RMTTATTMRLPSGRSRSMPLRLWVRTWRRRMTGTTAGSGEVDTCSVSSGDGARQGEEADLRDLSLHPTLKVHGGRCAGLRLDRARLSGLFPPVRQDTS